MHLADTSHRDAVRRVYPDARAEKSVNRWTVLAARPVPFEKVERIGSGETLADAWADAARNLPQESNDAG